MFKDSKTRNEQLYSKKIIELNTKIETLENQIKTTNGNIQKLNLEVKKIKTIGKYNLIPKKEEEKKNVIVNSIGTKKNIWKIKF